MAVGINPKDNNGKSHFTREENIEYYVEGTMDGPWKVNKTKIRHSIRESKSDMPEALGMDP